MLSIQAIIVFSQSDECFQAVAIDWPLREQAFEFSRIFHLKAS